jgi:hypothetical protein
MTPAFVFALTLQLLPAGTSSSPGAFALTPPVTLASAAMTPGKWAAPMLMLAAVGAGLTGATLLMTGVLVHALRTFSSALTIALIGGGAAALVGAGGLLLLAELERSAGGGGGPPGRSARDVRPGVDPW